jgi:hypothetical protein
MEPIAGTLLLGPDDEANRLWRGAQEAQLSAESSVVALCEALDLGIRAAEILAIELLRERSAGFPATIVQRLDAPDAEVDPYRDAMALPRSIQFTEVLDLLSDSDLRCVGPRLHRGWEDRRFSCARARATTLEALGFNIDADWRHDLLVLSAYRNRLFRCPPPVQLEPAEIVRAFPALRRLVEGLKGVGVAG